MVLLKYQNKLLFINLNHHYTPSSCSAQRFYHSWHCPFNMVTPSSRLPTSSYPLPPPSPWGNLPDIGGNIMVFKLPYNILQSAICIHEQASLFSLKGLPFFARREGRAPRAQNMRAWRCASPFCALACSNILQLRKCNTEKTKLKS